MKTISVLISGLIVVLLLTGCSGLVEFFDQAKGARTITPSKVIITEERPISGVTGVDLRSFGKVTITQGDREALTIEGSDNLVPLVQTAVSGGQLVIEMKENINIRDLNTENLLVFKLTVKDLTRLAVSGLGDIQMDALSTSTLKAIVSGAGKLTLNKLSAEGLDITVSGLGNVEIAGKVTQQTIEISGAGNVQNGDLECQTASVKVPGLGNATLWVTSQLTGNISGAGGVSYYGSPKTDIGTTGAGQFKALGDK